MQLPHNGDRTVIVYFVSTSIDKKLELLSLQVRVHVTTSLIIQYFGY